MEVTEFLILAEKIKQSSIKIQILGDSILKRIDKMESAEGRKHGQ